MNAGTIFLIVMLSMFAADVLGTVTTAAIAHDHTVLAMFAHASTDVLNALSMGIAIGGTVGLTQAGSVGMFLGSMAGVAAGMALSHWLEQMTGIHVPHRFRPRFRLRGGQP